MTKAKQALTHPASSWAAIIASALAIYGAKQDGEEINRFSHGFEAGHYEAIMDLRKKVDYLFGRVMEIEETKHHPPGGPSQPAPPDAGPTDAGATESSDAEAPAEQPPEEKPVQDVEPVPVPFQTYGEERIKWKPIKRK